MDILTYIHQMFEMAKEGKPQGVWFWVSVYTFVLCLYSAFFQIKTRYWQKTTGKLLKLGIKKFGSTPELGEQDYIGRALYSYSVKGITYESTKISPWIFVTNHNAKAILKAQLSKVERLGNDGVVVHYNPKRPKKSYLVVASKVGIIVTLLVSVTPLFLYLYEYHV